MWPTWRAIPPGRAPWPSGACPMTCPKKRNGAASALLEELQEGISTEINARYLGETVEVLFEEKVRGRWRGRTPTNKLVFLESEEDLRGLVRPVTITWTGPWSMQARLAGRPAVMLPVELISVTA